MIRLVVLILIIASCFGCDSGPIPPAKTAQPDTNATEQPTAASLPANPSPITGNNESHVDVNADLRDEQQRYVEFPAAGVKLVRPSGFGDAESFHGFQQPTTQSSVMVMMIPGPFSEVTHAFTTEELKTRGMTLRSKENVEINGENGVLLSVEQSAYGTDFAKWILAFGNETQTRMVTATFPQSEKANLSDELKAVVLSTKIADSPAPAPGADVGFTIAASSKLRLTTRLGGLGKMLVYMKDGAKSPEDPVFLAAPSLSTVPIDNKRQFAVKRLFQTALVKIGSVTFHSKITIDGLDGYELVADAQHADSGTPLKVYQVILYDDGSYILMQGRVDANFADEYLPEFKAMARSLTRNPR